MRKRRAFARRDGLDSARVGIIGSSAGGHLAATLLTHFDAGDPQASDPVERESSRPDLGILCYPVITMGEATHAGSRKNLLGDNPPVDLVALLSNEKQVTPQTPPCFIWTTSEDKTVPPENSSPDYQKILLDCIAGDQTVFTSTGEVLAEWKFVTPIVEQTKNLRPFEYKIGSHPEELI